MVENIKRVGFATLIAILCSCSNSMSASDRKAEFDLCMLRAEEKKASEWQPDQGYAEAAIACEDRWLENQK